MSSRPLIKPYHLVTDGDMSDDVISAPTIVQMLSMISYEISWDGTSPVGTITIQGSNSVVLNAAGEVQEEGTWSTLNLSAAAEVTGNTGNGSIDISSTGFYALRVVYTRASGTGDLQVIVNAKVA